MKKKIKERLDSLEPELKLARDTIANKRKLSSGQRNEYYQKWYIKQKLAESALLKRIQAREVPNSQPHLTPWKQ